MKLLLKYILILFASALLPVYVHAQQPTEVTLQLNWKHQFQFAGYYAAIEKGFYNQAGLQVNLLETTESRSPETAVFEGKADFGICTSDILLMRAQHKNAVVLATIFQHSPLVLLASEKSGIKHVQDLAGKRIELEPNAAEILAFMTDEGVSPDKCVIEKYTYDIDKLLNGEVDAISAYVTDEPFLLYQANFEYAVISPSMGGIDFYGDVLFTSEQYIRKNPEITDKFRKASLKGWKYAMDHPDEIIELIYSKYSKRHSIKHLQFEAEHMKNLIMPDVVEIGYTNPGRWKSIADTYKKLKMLDASFTTEGLLWTDYLEPKLNIPWKIIILLMLIILIIAAILYFYYYTSRRLKNEIKERARIEKNLTESEELYRAIFNNNSAAMVVIEPDSSVSMVNEAYCRMSGYTREETIGFSWTHHIPPHDRERLMEYNRRRLINPGDAPERYEFNIFHKNGEIRHSVMSITMIEGSRKIIASFIDITEQEKASQLLSNSQAELKAVYDYTPVMMCVIDEQRRILYANKSFTAFTGTSEDLLKGGHACGVFGCVNATDDTRGCGFGENCSKCTLKQAMEDTLKNKTVHSNVEYHATLQRKGIHRKVSLLGSTALIESPENNRLLLCLHDITERKQVEEALRESEEKFREMADLLPQIVFETDIEGKLTYVNKQAYKILKYPENFNITGLNTLDLYTPESKIRALENIQRRLTGKREDSNEYTIKRYDGSLMNVLVYSNSIVKDMKPVGLRGIIIDITKIKNAEIALRESENKYRILTESMKDVAWTLDPETMRFLYVSPSCEKQLGYKPQDIIGKSAEFILSPQKAASLTASIRRIADEIKAGLTSTDQFYTHELEQFGKDGIPVWTEIITHFVFIENPNRLEIHGVTHDITNRKHAEDELRRSEEKYRLITEYASDVIWVVNLTKRKYTYVSPAILQLRGLTVNEALAENLMDSFLPGAVEGVEATIKKEMSEFMQDPSAPNIYVHQARQRRKDGSIIWVELSSKYRYTADGDIEVVGLSRNIEDRKNMENEIRQNHAELQKLITSKDRFFSIIAHDLRSPFNGFLGLTQIMAEKLPELTMDEVQKIALSMKNSATNLFRLLENLLHWARIEQGLLPFIPQVIHLNPVLTESVEMALEPAKNKGIDIICQVPEDIEVYADTNMLQTIIRNLVSNAVKYTTRGGTVNLSAKSVTNNRVEISVQDNGIGMSEDILSKLFQINVQTNRKGTASEPSSGLGLIICKEFIEHHGGELKVESQVGKGSTFRFTLPCSIAEEEKTTAATGNIEVKEIKQPEKLKILLAEDDETSEMLMKISLKPFSKEILIARNGTSAVEICKQNPDIALILMDIKMPDMDGYEATRQIRQFNKKVVIIAQTAFGQLSDHDKAIDAGCNDYILKPLSITLLKELIMKHLGM